jgi:hypothetical protein
LRRVYQPLLAQSTASGRRRTRPSKLRGNGSADASLRRPAIPGGLVSPPPPKPNFTLIDTSGAPFISMPRVSIDTQFETGHMPSCDPVTPFPGAVLLGLPVHLRS